ncbi:chemotaxis protein CheX [Immundisolibacter sp.]|uniref:chemotaxis protein CheX n=1 Tax=Immundisolibacter sp. TaxID=1934948 RepID=UPI0035643341
MSIDTVDIEALTRETWSSMVGLDLLVTSLIEVPEPGISSQIEIQGDGELVLRIDCSLSLAQQATANLVDLPVDEVDLGLVMDTVGEMANILGGNIKGLWPGALKQSLPLTWETETTEPIMHAWAFEQAFDSAAGKLLVRMTKPNQVQ